MTQPMLLVSSKISGCNRSPRHAHLKRNDFLYEFSVRRQQRMRIIDLIHHLLPAGTDAAYLVEPPESPWRSASDFP